MSRSKNSKKGYLPKQKAGHDSPQLQNDRKRKKEIGEEDIDQILENQPPVASFLQICPKKHKIVVPDRGGYVFLRENVNIGASVFWCPEHGIVYTVIMLKGDHPQPRKQIPDDMYKEWVKELDG